MTYFKGGLTAATLAMTMAYSGQATAQDATLKIGGRLMLDYTTADVNSPDISVTDNEVRRARLFASGKYGSAVSYKFEFNHTTGDGIELTDGFVKFKPKGQALSLKVGHFKTHNSLEEETSSRFTSTIARGAFTDTFSLNRRLGVSVGAAGDNYTLNLGVYGESINGSEFEKDGNAIAARASYLPYQDDDTLVHIGGSWRYRNNSDSLNPNVNDGLRYRQRPYAHVFNSENTGGILPSGRIVSTPRFAKSDNMFAIEGLAIHKNLWVAGEYSLLNAKGAGTNANGDFSGGYIEAGYVIGGKRAYKKSSGAYDRTKVDNPLGEGGFGALSLVARYDTLDLQDGPYRGKLDTVVIGADWMPTKQTRLRLNYFDSDATNGAAESANGFIARLGFDF